MVMRISRIYVNQALTLHHEISLADETFHYLTRVLRARLNFLVCLFNGLGGEYQGKITAIDKSKVTVKLDAFNPENRESPVKIFLAQALSKGKRMDYVIQKATELGVHKIIPIITERTELKWDDENAEIRLNRWQQIIISACEQCGRNLLPAITHPIILEDWLRSSPHEKKIVLAPSATAKVVFSPCADNVALLVGPEGGLSQDELILTQQFAFQPLALGPRILRTETAPIVALSILQAELGDLLKG